MKRTDEEAARDAAASVLASLATQEPQNPSSLQPASSPAQTALPFANPYATPSGNQEISQLAPKVLLESATQDAPETKAETFGNASLDEETAKTIAAMTNEYNTRVRVPSRQNADMVPTPDLDALEMLEKVPVKKRQAPASDSQAGVKKPPAKKRKSEAPSDRMTPASIRQSPTPSTASGKGSKPPAPTKKAKSSKSAVSKKSTVGDDGSEADSDASDTELYCICRKPDDHTWMIGCDGPCGDWFHGKCVNMQKENQTLVDKYICPNCEAAGKGVTTWKPMCRAEGCRKPAILKKGKESKYCSRECGLKFMKSSLKRAGGQLTSSGPKKATRASHNGGAEETSPGPVGGTLRDTELKALADGISSIDEFRQLGSDPFLSPPVTASSEGNKSGDIKTAVETEVTETERDRLNEISARKLALRQKHLLLKDRSKFITMMRARIPLIAKKRGEKDVCGFDPIWSKDDISFKAWRESEEGKSVFDSGVLEVPADLGAKAEEAEITDAAPTASNPAPKICLSRAKCSRHGSAWSKLVLDDVRFETSQVGTEMRQIDAEEKDIRQRAKARARERGTSTDQPTDGWVEAAVIEQTGTPPPELPTTKMEGVRHAYELPGEGESNEAPNI